MTKTERLEAIIKHYSNGNKADFARFLDISPSGLSSWLARNTYDIELIFAKCEEISPDWLLTGKGNMLRINADKPVATPTNSGRGIPLIPVTAMAGFGTSEAQVLEYECERYEIPIFKEADFLIPVKGSSMYPKYSSGDIVACKKLLLQDIFFQWNKVYVLDTAQGALIKRIKKGSDKDHILIVSENEKYEPFELHISQINAVAVVIGVIRLE